MTPEERQKLIDERGALEAKMKDADFISPKDYRRVQDITSFLLSDGQTEVLRFGKGKQYKSHRVTSFTRDRQ